VCSFPRDGSPYRRDMAVPWLGGGIGHHPDPPPSGRSLDVRGSGNLLVVDDEAMLRNLAKFALERCGYTVELAQNGQEALNAFAARPDAFAAVILDLTMPVMAGEGALDRLGQLRADIPVPPAGSARKKRSKVGKGLSGFLQKPYTATAPLEKSNRPHAAPECGAPCGAFLRTWRRHGPSSRAELLPTFL
jgi:CheY-like chemotaxis protein